MSQSPFTTRSVLIGLALLAIGDGAGAERTRSGEHVARGPAAAGTQIFEFPEARLYGSRDQVHIHRGVSDEYRTRSLKSTNRLVLTFDDGPSPITTPRLLDTLKAYGVHATFFIVGEQVTPKTIPIIERMIREGHTIGNHSWRHDDSRTLDRAAFKAMFRRSQLAIERIQARVAPERTEHYFRFPYAAYGFQFGYQHMNVIKEVSNELFGDNCINLVFWNMDSADYVSDMTPDDIVRNVRAQFEGGSAFTYRVGTGGALSKVPYAITAPERGGVILMHDIHARTVDAIPKILDWARTAGVEIEPLDRVEEYSFGDRRCALKKEFLEPATGG